MPSTAPLKANESWSVTLNYSDFGENNFNGTKTFGGTQNGTIVVHYGQYALIDKLDLH